MKQTLLLVGNSDPVQIGAHLLHAGKELGVETTFCNMADAYVGPLWKNRVNWWLRGRLPTRLREFSAQVLQTCRDVRPTFLLSTGIAPIEETTLKEIGEMHVTRLNYLTDDPWNPVHRASWYFRAVLQYDYVFSPRRVTLSDLRGLGCLSACYLPFAYAPEIHFPEPPANEAERADLETDVVFAGGADRDRVPYMQALLQAGFKVALYGGYWERYPQTARVARGHIDPVTLRRAVSAAKVSLCLVRRANRDGHVMRTFELPAMGACMLTEDTIEHREIFGDDGEAVVYFNTRDEMVNKLRWLLTHDDERRRLAGAAHRIITKSPNTYHDRLAAMLERAST